MPSFHPVLYGCSGGAIRSRRVFSAESADRTGATRSLGGETRRRLSARSGSAVWNLLLDPAAESRDGLSVHNVTPTIQSSPGGDALRRGLRPSLACLSSPACRSSLAYLACLACRSSLARLASLACLSSLACFACSLSLLESESQGRSPEGAWRERHKPVRQDSNPGAFADAESQGALGQAHLFCSWIRLIVHVVFDA